MEGFVRYGREQETCNNCWNSTIGRNGRFSDPLVVSTPTLSYHLGLWIQIYNASTHNYSVWKYFEEWYQIDHQQVIAIVQCETKFTSLGLADRILSAIERNDLLHTEVIPVANPAWNLERWLEWQHSCDA